MRKILFVFCIGASCSAEKKYQRENVEFFGGGSFTCFQKISRLDMGINIQLGYHSFAGMDLGVGLVGKILAEWGSISGVRLSSLVDLGLKEKRLVNGDYKVDGSFLKGIKGALLIDIDSFSLGLYVNWSSKGLLSRKGFSIGLVFESRYQMDKKTFELAGVVYLGYVNKHTKSDMYSKFTNSAEKNNRLACYRAKALFEGLSEEELKEFTDLKKSK